MPIVNDLNNYAKEELEYFGVRRQNEENAAIEKAVFNTKFDLNYDFNGFFVIITNYSYRLDSCRKNFDTRGDYFFR